MENFRPIPNIMYSTHELEIWMLWIFIYIIIALLTQSFIKKIQKKKTVLYYMHK